MAKTTQNTAKKPSKLFLQYAAQLAIRFGLFAYGVYLFVYDRSALAINERFGFAAGFNFVDLVFVAIILDFATKFFSHANIAMGSLKQFKLYHIPTKYTFSGGRNALRDYFRHLVEESKVILQESAQVFDETRETLAASIRRILNNLDFLKLLPFKEHDLKVEPSQRQILYQDRTKEVLPALIFWVVFNAAIAGGLMYFNILNEAAIMLWMLFFFLFDMICVVFWCPIQLFLMKNRCCTTCQIFNWDAIMVATPLLFTGGWFSGILVALAIFIFLRWEFVAIRHPERFDERTNARLSCANCKDLLCHFRAPLETKASETLVEKS